MTFNLHLSLLVFVSWLLVDYLTSACDIEGVKDSAKGSLIGGWSDVAVDDSSVVQLKQTVVNDAIIVKAHHVIEAYQQVVAGVNYCIKFSASANCSTHQCQAVECVAGGFQPLPSGDQVQPVQRRSLKCTSMQSCDVERIRELAKTTMPGGWHAATKDDEYISQLYKNAAAIAAVRLGVVQEAFSQVVAGVNYCIQFDSTGSANCNQQCQPLSCVASGFLPLPSNTNNPGVVSMIGVQCKPGGELVGYTENSTGTTASATIASLMTTIVSTDTSASPATASLMTTVVSTDTSASPATASLMTSSVSTDTSASPATASLMTSSVMLILARVLGSP